VLALGDSFCNIFSIPSLGWGMSAGLAEQLSYYLQRPMDRITMNDNGSYATRQELARESAGNPARLAGKKVVIWQFACRELAFGNWKDIPANSKSIRHTKAGLTPEDWILFPSGQGRDTCE
jgi:alginate O-acetyltransferase complex protein AlgJ